MKQVTAAPLDIEELAARLTAAAAAMDTPSRPSRGRSLTLSPEPRIIEDFESACYHELIEDGGRPPFPLSRLEEVLNDPESHHELLRPWVQDLRSRSRDDGQAISRERDRWLDFRKWQLDNRGIAADEGFPEYLEAKRRDYKAMKASELTDDPEFEDTMRRRWERERGNCQQQQDRNDRGVEIFSAYAEVAKRRLADHGFTQPLQLEEDPKRQDQWTTWVEYLEFEYWWLDRLTSSVKSLQSQHDMACKTLTAAKVLKGTEREEDLVTTEAEQRRKTEANEATLALCLAEEASTLVQQATNTRKRYKASRGAQKLGAAKELIDVTRRNEAIGEFMRKTEKYRAVQASEQRQLYKVQWVLQQVSEIKAAQILPPREEKPKLTEGGKRMRQGDDGALPRSNVKRRKEKHGEEDTAGALLGSEAAPVTKQRSARIRGTSTADAVPIPARTSATSRQRQSRRTAAAPSRERLKSLRPRDAGGRVKPLGRPEST